MRTFTWQKITFLYAQQPRPLTDQVPHRGERTVEVPLGQLFLTAAQHRPVLEVGCVMPYWPGHWTHDVLDPYDVWPSCIRADALEYDYTGRAVLSISTLEHIGRPEYGETRDDRHLAGVALNRILAGAAEYLITLPVGYHPELDSHVRHLATHPPRPDWSLTMLKQIDGDNTWIELPTPDWSLHYGRPLPYANGVVVMTNLPTP